MSDPQRVEFKVPATVPPVREATPKERYDRAWQIASNGERPNWDAFEGKELEDLRHVYYETRWEFACDAMRIPSRLRFATMYQGRPTTALARVQHYLTGEDWSETDQDMVNEYGEGCCLVLTGPTGIGKTYAAVAGLRALQEFPRVPPRRFWYFPALCGALLDPERRKEALQDVTKVKMLVLDDLGVEYVKEGGLIDTFLDEIIWTREAEFLPTIITTNLTAEALKQRLPGRLIDRLRGDWGRVFECPGESLRTTG